MPAVTSAFHLSKGTYLLYKAKAIGAGSEGAQSTLQVISVLKNLEWALVLILLLTGQVSQ